jgi:hypothetical protein
LGGERAERGLELADTTFNQIARRRFGQLLKPRLRLHRDHVGDRNFLGLDSGVADKLTNESTRSADVGPLQVNLARYEPRPILGPPKIGRLIVLGAQRRRECVFDRSVI